MLLQDGAAELACPRGPPARRLPLRKPEQHRELPHVGRREGGLVLPLGPESLRLFQNVPPTLTRSAEQDVKVPVRGLVDTRGRCQ